jgi:co-chaperonin GroES (HSP10)
MRGAMNTPIKTPAFRPGGARYLVLADIVETKSETIGEVTISERPDPHKQADHGTIVARGKACADYEIGDQISYGQFSGYDLEIDGQKFKILQEGEILGQKIRTPFDEPTNIPGIYEVHPDEPKFTVCDECFCTVEGQAHYEWCATLRPAPEPAQPQAAVPKPPPTPGICSDCGCPAGTPEGTTCLDCMAF